MAGERGRINLKLKFRSPVKRRFSLPRDALSARVGLCCRPDGRPRTGKRQVASLSRPSRQHLDLGHGFSVQGYGDPSPAA